MPIRAYKKHFELANLDGLRSNNFSTRTHECGKSSIFDSLYIQMDIASACIFGYTFPAALFFTVHAYMSIKEYIVEYLYNDS